MRLNCAGRVALGGDNRWWPARLGCGPVAPFRDAGAVDADEAERLLGVISFGIVNRENEVLVNCAWSLVQPYAPELEPRVLQDPGAQCEYGFEVRCANVKAFIREGFVDQESAVFHHRNLKTGKTFHSRRV